MKRILNRIAVSLVLASSAVSCTTAYDAYGRPRQVVEPGAALVGAAAAGLLAYGLANSNNHRHYDRSYRDNCYTPRQYYRPSYGRYGRCY